MGSVREFQVPEIGDFDDVEVIEILVAVGDTVAVEQSICTLESEKATMELPSPFAGVVVGIDIAVGDKVSEGSPVCRIEVAEGAPQADAEDAAAAPGPASPEPEPEPQPEPEAEPAPSAPAPPASPEAAAPATGRGLEEHEPVATLPAPPARRAHASPSVRRLANELGVDLARVSGTGRKSRILKQDVQGFVKAALAEAPGAEARGRGLVLPEAPEIDFSKFGEVEVQPLNKVRRIAARNLHRSWLSIPHVTQFDEADITDLEEFRRAKLDEAGGRGVKLTLLVFLMKALEVTLKDFPAFKSSLHPSGESLILKKYTHIGVAVDTEHGLVVPVIRDVDRKGLLTLAGELALVSQRARDRRLSPQDLSGGCITISSLGGIGGTAFTPIVNAPEVAILGVSRSRIAPVHRGGEFAPRLMLPLSLSYDHRVIDGADAVRFTTRLKTVLSDIRNLIL